MLTRHMPTILGGVAALLVLRGMARGGLGVTAQKWFLDIFVQTSTGNEQ